MVSVETIQSNLEATYRKRTPQSRVAFERALASLPGGDTRSSMFDTPYPMFVSHGEGARLFDVDGNEYLDLVNNYTALIHGHAHPHIVRAISEQAARGACHGAPVELQTRLAEGVTATVQGIGSLAHVHLGIDEVREYRASARARSSGGWHWLRLALVNRGVFVPPRALFALSTPMTEADVDETLGAFREAVGEVRPILVANNVTAAV